MKLALSSIITIAAFLSPTQGQEIAKPKAKTYILAKKGHLPPIGSKYSVNNSMALKNGVMKMKMGEQGFDATVETTQKESENYQFLAKDRIRITQTESESTNKVVMMGNEQPAQKAPTPLLNQPVVLTKKENKWTGQLEDGNATEEQKKAIEKIAQKINDDNNNKLYGYEPRKIGDKWKTAPGNFLGQDDLKGEVTVNFLRTEKFNGIECAVLSCEFDVSGSNDDFKGATMTLTGKATIHRSLQDLVDLNIDFKGCMEMKGDMAEGLKMEMKGDMNMKSKATLTK